MTKITPFFSPNIALVNMRHDSKAINSFIQNCIFFNTSVLRGELYALEEQHCGKGWIRLGKSSRPYYTVAEDENQMSADKSNTGCFFLTGTPLKS